MTQSADSQQNNGTFTIELAGATIAITALHDDVRNLCRDYIVPRTTADIAIATAQADIEFEHSRTDEEFSDGYLETLAVYRKIAAAMAARDTFLMHGSVLAVGNEAYMFTAPSGTGKTTHSRLWLSGIPGSYIVNGDKPLITISEQNNAAGAKIGAQTDAQPSTRFAAIAHGTPWCGKEGWNTKTSVPLKAIVILERGEENSITEISAIEAYPAIYPQIHRPADIPTAKQVLDLSGKLLESVRCYRLTCNMDPEAAFVAYNGLKTDRK